MTIRAPLRRATVAGLFSSASPSPAALLPPSPCTLQLCPSASSGSEAEAYGQGQVMGKRSPGCLRQSRASCPVHPAPDPPDPSSRRDGRARRSAGAVGAVPPKAAAHRWPKRSMSPQAPTSQWKAACVRLCPCWGSGLAPFACHII